ncbi:3-hydroxyacyl-CoA dehydrogenase [Carnimonas bestiolae]|uniref:3-hydroxyacyl-CoA dehydrogenase n=1 Tax=Carnimonas bestiolae TaxID=3402172 RepID=UPI003EDBC86E
MPYKIERLGVVGTGVMGAGIAQVAAQHGLAVKLYDARPGAAQAAFTGLENILNKLASKGKFSQAEADAAVSNLEVVDDIAELADAQLVIEAIIEELDAKRAVFEQLETVVDEQCILASNTSSLSVTAIARGCKHPGRIAGLHFFNPVPLMKVVEVIGGLETEAAVFDALVTLTEGFSYRALAAKDSPGFIINHAGRALTTEGFQILGEQVATFADVDRVLREGMGFRMGPFELADLTGLDVSQHVMESVFEQFYYDPRYRPSPIGKLRVEGGYFGRKNGRSFYAYQEGKPVRHQQLVPKASTPSVWIKADQEDDQQAITALVTALGATVEEGDSPSADALCLLAPYGVDATTAALEANTNPAHTLCIDPLIDLERHRCLIQTPATEADYRDAAHALLASDGTGVTLINDSVGFIAQRTLATIVNTGCDIVQRAITSPADLDDGVRLGLGYPFGPLAWGDQLGPQRLLSILERMTAITQDPRYRPSPWLRRRAALGLSLVTPEPSLSQQNHTEADSHE